MRRSVCFAVFIAVLAGGTGWAQMGKTAVLPPSAAGTAHPSAYNFPTAQYPRIEADNRVTFQLRAPDAQKVQVSIANTPFDMVKGENGVWTYTTAEPRVRPSAVLSRTRSCGSPFMASLPRAARPAGRT